MPPKTNRPAGMRARRDRNGTATYYLLRRNGTKLVLGTNFERACLLWVEEQRSLVKLAPPTAALGLLVGFELCSLTFADMRRAARRSNEIRTLRSYFAERNDPNLDAINGEVDFLTWCRNNSRSGAPDATIRLFRMIWKFAIQLEFVNSHCPWRTLDLRKDRLNAEAADVVRHFASSPLKEFLEEFWDAKNAPEVERPAHIGPAYAERLRVELAHAVTRATLTLRKCGRPDLLAPVYQLKIDDLVALRDSPVLALSRPPGIIFLNHHRSDILASLKATNSSSDGLDGDNS